MYGRLGAGRLLEFAIDKLPSIKRPGLSDMQWLGSRGYDSVSILQLIDDVKPATFNTRSISTSNDT